MTVTAANKTACIKEMKIKEQLWNKQQRASGITMGKTVVELCQLHLNYQIEQEELKPKSIDRRECTINQIEKEAFGKLQLQAVRMADVDKFISGLIQEDRLAASSIEKIVDVLNASYNWALVRGELENNPVLPVKPTLKNVFRK